MVQEGHKRPGRDFFIQGLVPKVDSTQKSAKVTQVDNLEGWKKP